MNVMPRQKLLNKLKVGIDYFCRIVLAFTGVFALFIVVIWLAVDKANTDATFDCAYSVTTLASVPYDAINERNEILGHFERQPDGNIWLMNLDTSVQDASRCLRQKGYTAGQLSKITPR